MFRFLLALLLVTSVAQAGDDHPLRSAIFNGFVWDAPTDKPRYEICTAFLFFDLLHFRASVVAYGLGPSAQEHLRKLLADDTLDKFSDHALLVTRHFEEWIPHTQLKTEIAMIDSVAATNKYQKVVNNLVEKLQVELFPTFSTGSGYRFRLGRLEPRFSGCPLRIESARSHSPGFKRSSNP